jgi:hypothetical protein
MDWRDSYHVTCFLCGLRHATIELCFLCVVRAERIREWKLTSLEFRSSKGTAVWPKKELEDVTCAIVTVILRVYELIVVTTSEEPINRFTNPNPRLSH